jgi:predicted amidohydrolase YtcJ
MSGSIDLILYNGHIVTVDENFSETQALAIAGDKLAAVGRDEEIVKLGSKSTRMIDLRGATVLPGINDAHIHLAWWGLSLSQIDLRGKNIEEIQASLVERVTQIRPGEVIRGVGWSEGSIGRMPTKEDLDKLTPDNPVVFEEMGHALWVNSKMLELAGISNDAMEPAGAKFERDSATGDLTGVFHEVDHLIFAHIPKISDARRKRAIVDAIEVLNRQGVTSVTDPGVALDGIALYEELAGAGSLSARVSAHLRAGRSLLEAQKVVTNYADKSTNRGTTNNLLTLRGIKLFMDGAPPGHTALMFDDYSCCPGEKGLLLYQGENEEQQIEEIFSSIEWLHRQGYQMGIHADGDRSASIAIAGLIQAMVKYPVDPNAPKTNGLRHYLIHGDLIRDDDIALMAEWHIGLAIQPVITFSAGHLLLDIWGQDRGARHMATGLFIRAGVWTSLSTDAPIVPPDWKQNIEFAVLRENKFSPDKVNGPNYRISVKDGIIAHTITPAYQDFQEDIKGSIEEGKLADLVVIDEDILSIDPHRISDIDTLMTIVGGNIVYRNSARFGEDK